MSCKIWKKHIDRKGIETGPNTIQTVFPTSFNIQCLGNLKESYNPTTFSSLCLFMLRTECFFLREDGGPLKDKGKWKCVLANKTVFLNKDLGRQLTGDKVSSHKLVLEGHISVLSFSDDFCSQAMLSCAALSSWAPSSPGPHWLEHSQLQQGPAAGKPPGRGQNSQAVLHKLFSGYPNAEAQPGPVPAWEEEQGEQAWVGLGRHSAFVL